MIPRRRAQRPPLTPGDTPLVAALDVIGAGMIVIGTVGAIILGEPLVVALMFTVGVAALLARHSAARDAQLGDCALDVAQLRRELDSCEHELNDALRELASRDTEGGAR